MDRFRFRDSYTSLYYIMHSVLYYTRSIRTALWFSIARDKSVFVYIDLRIQDVLVTNGWWGGRCHATTPIWNDIIVYLGPPSPICFSSGYRNEIKSCARVNISTLKLVVPFEYPQAHIRYCSVWRCKNSVMLQVRIDYVFIVISML